jgi:hypothetical protein
MRPAGWPTLRFDVIGIVLPDGGAPQLRHIAAAF